MKITIDTDKVDKDIGIDGLLYLTASGLGSTINIDTINRLNSKGLFTTTMLKDNIPYETIISKEAIEVIEGAYADMEMPVSDRFDVLADKLRELYPLGRKEGTSLQWRDSTKIISNRLKAFVKKFNVEFTDEQAVEATRKYIESFNGCYTYMQVLKYFIMKSGIEDGNTVVNSQLLSYMENPEETNNDWTTNLV